MNTDSVDLTLILPAYNEAASIAATLEEAFDYFDSRSVSAEIIVAADGDDGTREIVRDLRSRYGNRLLVMGHKERSGKGRGVREAVAEAHGALIGFADADNKVPIDEID